MGQASAMQEDRTREHLLQAVQDLCKDTFGLEVQRSASGVHTTRGTPTRCGVQALRGEVDDGVLSLSLELAVVAASTRVPVVDLCAHFAALDDRIGIEPPEANANDESFRLTLRIAIRAEPLGMARSAALQKQLRQIDLMARDIQAFLPESIPGADARLARYKDLADHLAPVSPLSPLIGEAPRPELRKWAEASARLLDGALSLALVSEQGIDQQVALACLAEQLERQGGSLGQLTGTAVGCQGLVELAGKAPGPVALPAIKLRVGANPYEIGNEAQLMLTTLAASGHAALFLGTMRELQSVFQGGQGSLGDPLHPVVLEIPADAVPLSQACRFALAQCAQPHGGLSAADLDSLAAGLELQLSGALPSDQKRFLLPAAASIIAAHLRGAPAGAPGAAQFIAAASACRATLGGPLLQSRGRRSPTVQAHFAQCLLDPALESALTTEILGQNAALAQVVERLRIETLSRPTHQPLRVAFQGTPGVGKSDTARILADWLGLPHVNIDAASLSDPHTAASLLLGSGRGIVGSYRPGKLEEIARHHTGALVELSDLDHARSNVRASLADLFLQILDFGHGQSATGASFSCANLIIVFSLNLPDGADERLRRPMGFHRSLDTAALQQRVESELVAITSSAFLSRLGSPILFQPLQGPALAMILERAIEAGVRAAAGHLGPSGARISVAAGLGQRLLPRHSAVSEARGARGLQELGRALAVRAAMALNPALSSFPAGDLHITDGPNGDVTIRLSTPPA